MARWRFAGGPIVVRKCMLAKGWIWGVYVEAHCLSGTLGIEGSLVRDSPEAVTVKRQLKNRQKMVLMENGSLMKVESIAECNTFDLH